MKTTEMEFIGGAYPLALWTFPKGDSFGGGLGVAAEFGQEAEFHCVDLELI